jgi:hypothetical protein
MSDSGRTTKGATKDLGIEDGQVDLWEMLKARFAYLSNPRKTEQLVSTLRKRIAAAQKKPKRNKKK